MKKTSIFTAFAVSFSLFSLDVHKHIDLKFVSKQEGFRTKGYIPMTRDGRIVGNSGVTIAGGLDLGQRRHLNDLRLSSKLKDKLSPYLNLRREKALRKLKERPLVLSLKESKNLKYLVHICYFRKLKRYYKRKTGKDFLKLPRSYKTVLYNIYYNTGSIGKRTLNYAKSTDLIRLVHELYNYYKAGTRRDKWFGPKRAAEAQYLLLN